MINPPIDLKEDYIKMWNKIDKLFNQYQEAFIKYGYDETSENKLQLKRTEKAHRRYIKKVKRTLARERKKFKRNK